MTTTDVQLFFVSPSINRRVTAPLTWVMTSSHGNTNPVLLFQSSSGSVYRVNNASEEKKQKSQGRAQKLRKSSLRMADALESERILVQTYPDAGHCVEARLVTQFARVDRLVHPPTWHPLPLTDAEAAAFGKRLVISLTWPYENRRLVIAQSASLHRRSTPTKNE